jgi:hypothetical protein
MKFCGNLIAARDELKSGGKPDCDWRIVAKKRLIARKGRMIQPGGKLPGSGWNCLQQTELLNVVGAESLMRSGLLIYCVIALAVSGGEPAAEKPQIPAVPAQAAVPEVEAPWIKAETKFLPLPAPRQILSPGFFDHEIQGHIVFDKKGECNDTGLPHPKGRNTPLFAKMIQAYFWIDFNGDGKPGAGETSQISKDGWSEPLQYDAKYDGGIVEPYIFRVNTVVEKEKYAIVRSCARVGEIDGQKIVFLDDNGNGRYNDIAKDALIAGDSPVTFLGKYVLVGEKFFEVLMQPSGTTFEYRAAPKLELGAVDLFERYKPSQKSENLKIHTLIITGASGSYSMSARERAVKVPAGAYDFAFGLFERAKETVYLKNGEKTTFSVSAGKVAVPEWGGEIEAKFALESDGTEVVINPPVFTGKMTERYFPESYEVLPLTGGVSQIFEDRLKVEHKRPFGGRRFDLLPNGQLEPLRFKPYRNHADEYEATISYNSGILGAVLSKQRIQYIPPSKPPKKTN